MHVGNLCRDRTVSRVAEIERLHHTTAKDLDKLYMRRQIESAGASTPRAIGVDECWATIILAGRGASGQSS